VELLDLPIVPLSGGLGAFVWLVVYFVRRSDKWTLENLHELKRQRDEAIARERAERRRAERAEDVRDRYMQLFGPLPEVEGEMNER
jgi:hypothetical protein